MSYSRPGFLLLVVAAFLAGSSLPGSADFLLLEPSARSLGAGGASVASPGSVSSLRDNPAGLASISGLDAALSHQSAFDEWSHEWVAVGRSFGGNALAAEFIQSRVRSFDLFAADGSPAGTGSAGSEALGLAWAAAVGNLSLGSSLHVFSSQLASFNSKGACLDLGLLYRVNKSGFRFGLAGQNFGMQSSFDSGKESLPALLRGGASWLGATGGHGSLELGSEFVAYANPSFENEGRAGARLTLFKLLSLCGGYQFTASGGQLTFGLGANFQSFELSYAMLPGGPLGDTQLVSLEINL